MAKVKYPNSKKVEDAYNDLGHLGRHKLSIEELMVLNASLSEMIRSHLLFYNNPVCGLKYIPFKSDAPPSYLAGEDSECSSGLQEQEHHTPSQDIPNSPQADNNPS